MGVAPSPQWAQLYGLTFELAAFGKDMHRFPDIAFYGRYIDDILALVYAEDKWSARAMIENNLEFHNCTIEWSSSDKFMTFLDMTLFLKDNRLQHKPFRKPMNHFECIPWISAHPEYVKRGTFCGKLSRIASLCSHFEDYMSACREICDIYIARGYPPKLVASWLRINSQKRWEARLREDEQTKADVLVLKSEYNLSWDFFNVHTLEEQMKTRWKEAMCSLSFGGKFKVPKSGAFHPDILATKPNLSLLSNPAGFVGAAPTAHTSNLAYGMHGSFLRLDKLGLLDKRLIISKRKTKQLIDLTSLWRKSVLE